MASIPKTRGKAELDLLWLAEAHPAHVDALLPTDLLAAAIRGHRHALAQPDGDGLGEA